MAKKTLNITGDSDKTYDLDTISAESRTNTSKPLVVQVYEYSAGESPNPISPKLGQIWISKKKE